ncbi:site-specific integrase [bacterium]|nr:site-specific integrase [bacterium]
MTEQGKKKELFALKDTYIINDLNKRITRYEDLKSQKLGFRIEMYTARELAKYFESETKPGSDSTINFVEFSRNHIEKLKAQGRTSYASNINSSLNSLIDFCNGREKIAITEITSKFLTQNEAFLRTTRTIKRKDQFGKMVTTKKRGLSDLSVIDYMTNIRLLFNAAMAEYNDEDKDEIRIIHYPFRKYKLKRRPENEKRNLTKEQLVVIRDVDPAKIILERAIFSRDIFMLSFYLVGMNFADLYEVDKIKAGRFTYERKKTKGRRQDRALISIKIEPEAEQLVEKYRDPSGERVFDFHKRYSTSHIFSSNVNKGLKVVAKACKIDEPLSTYYARHTWATIARNKAGISKDDVDLALNHVDQGLKMADAYIEKDWSLIDKANRGVLDYFKKPYS